MKKLYNIAKFGELDSTNAYALRNLSDLPDRHVVIANKQTAGRGRFERKWISDKEGNVYLSIVLKPCSYVNNNLPLSCLTQYLSVIACQTIESYGIKTEIKYPNDILIERKKIAGILSQASVQGDDFKGIVLGIGVNLNLTLEDISSINQPATSLNLLTETHVCQYSFTEKLLDDFFGNYHAFLNRGFPFIKEEYISRINFLGRRISVKIQEKTISGEAKEIKDNGTLIIIDEEQEHHILTGDIIF